MRIAYSTSNQMKNAYLSPAQIELITARRQSEALPRHTSRFWPAFIQDRYDRHRVSPNDRKGQPKEFQPPLNREDQVDIHRPATILVVEDEMIVALDLQFALERMGYIVVGIARSGQEAIQQALTSHPDVILLDIHLDGDMDGFEAAKQIGHHHKAAIIFLTAQADEGTVNHMKDTDSVALLFKPFSEPMLQVTLEEALSLPDGKKDSPHGSG